MGGSGLLDRRAPCGSKAIPPSPSIDRSERMKGGLTPHLPVGGSTQLSGHTNSRTKDGGTRKGKVVAGVAGGKAALVAALGTGAAREFANTPAGHQGLLAWPERRQVDLVVCEPSGGYAQAMARRRHQAQRAVRLAAPRRARA